MNPIRQGKGIAFIFFIIIGVIRVGFSQEAALVEKARRALIEGNYTRVIELLKSYEGQNAETLRISGLAYKGLRQYQNALNALQKVLAFHSQDTDLLFSIGTVYEGLGNTAKAKETFRQILRKDSLNLNAQIHLAAVWFQENDFRKAASWYSTLLERDKGNTYFLRRLGVCLFKQKEYVKATDYFLQALKVNPKDISSALYLGNSYLKKDKLSAALQAALNGLREHPQNKRLLKLKADVLFQQKSYAAAVAAYQTLINRGTVSRDVYKKLGLSYYYLHNLPPALLALQKTVQADTTDGLALYYLGLVHKDLGDYAQGAALLKRAITLMIPDYIPDMFAQLAYCQDKERKFSDAIQSYKRALQWAPERTIYLFFIASLYDRYYKDKQIALDQYQRFIEEAPEAEKQYKEYALERMKALKENIHFQKGRIKKH